MELLINIRHFKLINGEEIIGLLAIKNDDNFIIESPVLVHNNIIGGYQFTPWFPFSDTKSFKILKSDIIQHVSIAHDAKNAYMKFALKMNKSKQPQYRSDLDILKELDDLYPPDESESESEGKTIH